MARSFMKYLEEITGSSAGGTMAGDVGTFARPIGSGPVKRIYPQQITGLANARVTTYPPDKNKKTRRK